MISKKTFKLILLLIFLTGRISYIFGVGSGLTSANSLNIIPDPKTSAMGGGSVADVSGLPSSAFNNPASLLGLERAKLSFSNAALFEGLRYNFISFALLTTYGNLGGSISHLNYGDFRGYDASFNRINVPESYDVTLLMTYAFPLKTTVPILREYGAVGLNLKLMQNKLSNYSQEAVAIDLGGIYNVSDIDGLSLGFCYKNLGSGMKFVRNSYSLPASFNFGLSYRDPSAKNIQFVLDYMNPDQGEPNYSLGISLSPAYFLTLRAGLRQANNSMFSDFRGGIGFEFGEFSLDYAFTPAKYVSGIHNVGINLAIGRILKIDKASDYYLDKHFRAAQEYYIKKDYITARQKFEEILSTYPDHTPSNEYLEKISAAMEEMEQQKERNIKRWLRKGNESLEKKDYIFAKVFFDKVLNFEPENGVARAGLENVERKLLEVKQEKTRQQNRAKINSLWKMGIYYYLKGDFVKSKDRFYDILAIDPDNENAKRYIVEVDNQLTRIAASELGELYTQATELYKAENYEEAIKYFEAVTVAAPQRMDARDFVEQCRQKIEERKQKEEARKLVILQENAANEMESVYNKALNNYESGNYETSLKYFLKSEELATQFQFEKYLGSIKDYISIIKINLAEQYYKKGFGDFKNNRFESAAVKYKKAIEYNPEHESAKFELERISKDLAQKYYEEGMAYFSRSEMQKAREMFQRSLQYQPDKDESLRALEKAK